MKKFDYNEYNDIARVLDNYYATIGFNHETVFRIREQLRELYDQMREGLDIDESHALRVINNFVSKCKKIKDAFYYPICVQECLQALILIALYPFEEYKAVETAAYDAAHIFHTFINHPGE